MWTEPTGLFAKFAPTLMQDPLWPGTYKCVKMLLFQYKKLSSTGQNEDKGDACGFLSITTCSAGFKAGGRAAVVYSGKFTCSVKGRRLVWLQCLQPERGHTLGFIFFLIFFFCCLVLLAALCQAPGKKNSHVVKIDQKSFMNFSFYLFCNPKNAYMEPNILHVYCISCFLLLFRQMSSTFSD